MRSTRITCAAALSGIIMLCGCSVKMPFASEKLPDMNSGFSSSAEITYGKSTAKADIDRIEPGRWEFTFTSPDELAGVVMTVENGKLSAGLGELSVSDNGGDHTALPLIIAGGIDLLSDIDASRITEKDGVLTAHGKTSGSSFTVTIDKQTGDILSFRSPSEKLSVYFSDVSPYTDEAGLEE